MFKRPSPEEIALQTLVEALRRELEPILSIPKQYFSEQEASWYVGVSVHSLRAWRSKSEGPDYFKVRGRVLYGKDDLDTYVRGHKIKTKKGLHNGRAGTYQAHSP